MAKMHSRAKGKSRSTKPETKTAPVWVRYDSKEVEILVAKLAKEGFKPSQIGLRLRDIYGIPDVKLITGKKISQILKEKGIQPKLPENLTSLIKKAAEIKKHLEIHKKDNSAKRGLTLTESKIKRLVKYYKRTKVLPKEWSYDPENIRLYIE